ncbi:MAG: DUF21 domain-containing protein [Sedimentisphaerales bacterium]|nr:DUF21 domain-containing protein [Sedimentisphaerales bacterium]
MSSNLINILWFVLLISLAGFYSGSETGMYQLSRLRLRLGVEKKKWSYRLLGKCLSDSPGMLLSLLLGTNLANYFATSIITYIFLQTVDSEYTAQILTTALAAPLLFVFSELIPKNIFFYRADSLMPYVAPLIYTSDKLFKICGIAPLLKLISGLFGRLVGLSHSSKTALSSAQSRQAKGIFHETREEGVLSAVQNDMIGRILGIPGIHVWSVMIPINKVKTIDIGSDRKALMQSLHEHDYTRWPVTDKVGDIIGYINIYDVLGSSEEFAGLQQFIKPIRELDAGTSVTEAIGIMQRENLRIMIVTRAGMTGHTKPVGILTMKDLAEELLGELAEW